MPTLLEIRNIEDTISLFQELELDFIEINTNMIEFSKNNIDTEKYKKIKKNTKIEYTFHLADDLDIAHFDENVRRASLKTVKEYIEICKKIDAKVLNLHFSEGIKFTLPNKTVLIYDEYIDKYLENFKLFIEMVEEACKNTDIIVSFENTGIHKYKFVQEAIKLIDKTKNLGLTYDIGHNHIYGKSDKEIIYNHFEKVNHFHIHDATGKNDHKELFTGEIDILSSLKEVNSKKARAVIEVKTIEALKRSVKKLREI